MKPSAALALHREAIRGMVVAHRTCNPRVFGSTAAGSDKDGSDLDILVDPLPGATLFDLGSLQVDLEDLLGIPVDLVTPSDLPASFRSETLASARPL